MYGMETMLQGKVRDRRRGDVADTKRHSADKDGCLMPSLPTPHSHSDASRMHNEAHEVGHRRLR